MLTRVSPIEFVKPTQGGRTKPALLLCEKADGSTVEVVAKFSAGCDEATSNLAREVIARVPGGRSRVARPRTFPDRGITGVG